MVRLTNYQEFGFAKSSVNVLSIFVYSSLINLSSLKKKKKKENYCLKAWLMDHMYVCIICCMLTHLLIAIMRVTVRRNVQ